MVGYYWVRWVYRLGDEEQSCGEGLGILVDGKFNISWQHALAAQKANRTLEYNKRSRTRRPRKVIPLFRFTLMRPHLQYCVYLRDSQHGNNMELCGSKRGYRLIRELEYFSVLRG